VNFRVVSSWTIEKRNCFDSKVLEVSNEENVNNDKLMLEISQNTASQLILKTKLNSMAFSPRGNYTDRAAAAGRRS
jgi:hypothetical protein